MSVQEYIYLEYAPQLRPYFILSADQVALRAYG